MDEEKFGASGCSIDKQLKFIKELEQKFSIELLNRLLVAYKNRSGNIEVVSPSRIKELFEAGEINADTIIFNPAVSNTTELENNFEIPLKESWLNAKYKLVTA